MTMNFNQKYPLGVWVDKQNQETIEVIAIGEDTRIWSGELKQGETDESRYAVVYRTVNDRVLVDGLNALLEYYSPKDSQQNDSNNLQKQIEELRDAMYKVERNLEAKIERIIRMYK